MTLWKITFLRDFLVNRWKAYLTLGFYDLAQRHLTQLSIKSNADDVYYLYLEYYYQTGQFAEFKNMIREMQGKQVVLSKDKQDLLNFWQGK